MGTGQGQQKINFDQTAVCKSCGRYGHIEVYVLYSYFSLFFIPIIKWNKRYYVRMTCCNRTVEIDRELAHKIKDGEVTYISQDIFKDNAGEHREKVCSECGFTTLENYNYCPKCSSKLYIRY